MIPRTSFTIVGAGLAGTLLASLLAQRGHTINLVERRPDPRQSAVERGRSINLALAARGLNALALAGLEAQVRRLLIPMQGRMLHDLDGHLTAAPYGQGPHEVIYSISRSGLNELLLDAADASRNISVQFECAITGVRIGDQAVQVQTAGAEYRARHVIAADGAGSVVRRAMIDSQLTTCSVEMLSHGYKELTLPPRSAGTHALHANSLHIWPRGGFMLIALPNLDGTFTVTLFLPHHGDPGFDQLSNSSAVRDFFQTHFADAAALMPQLESEFFAHPVGEMGTVRTGNWAADDRLLLIGDAAHAIVPFHGQGMNCALEDCARLVALLDEHTSVADAFAAFARERVPQANAIADMALENYIEMRDSVRDPTFLLQRALSLELERRSPERFVPRYSMVMFHHEIPYAVAYERGRIQSGILEQLTRSARSLDQVNYTDAAQLIHTRLPPIRTLTG